MEIQTREPEIFAAGDTLSFTRTLPDYPAGDGWALTYVLTSLAGEKLATVTSTADGDNHKVYQDDFAITLDQGDYLLTGQVKNGAEDYTIYRGVLTLQADLTDGTASQPQKTEAQEMIDILRDSLKDLYRQKFSVTNVQHNQFVLQKQSEVLEQWKYWKEVRNNEIQWERAQAGKPTGAVRLPVFNVG